MKTGIDPLLAFIHEHQLEHGYPPSTRDVMAKFGWVSSNAVHDALGVRERAGLMTRIHAGMETPHRTWRVHAIGIVR